MDDMIQNPEAQKLAQMLQQQQMQKFLQALQGAGSGAMTNADMQMAQMPMNTPQGNYQMPVTQPEYAGNMPMGAGSPRRGMLEGAISEMDKRNMMQQGMGQGAMSNADMAMMRRMPR